jgi:hypothetical protein
MFADDMTVIDLITDNDETACSERVSDLAVWCQVNNLNVSKIMDYRKRGAEHTTFHIDGVVVERVEIFMFLSVHVTKDLSWSEHTKTVLKKAKIGHGPSGPKKTYTVSPLRAS